MGVHPIPPGQPWLGEQTKTHHLSPLSQPAQLSIGVVVPVFNEAAILERSLERLGHIAKGLPVVVADGGSTDGSARIARRLFHTEVMRQPNRGAQMNRGAQCLNTEVLVFLHADSELPPGFESHIRRALRDPRVAGGCFQLQFDLPDPMLRFYCWFTRFSWRLFHFGDQAFFVRREVFHKLGGFRETSFLEDVDFLRRLRRAGGFAVLPVAVRTSARRFARRGIVRQQLVNILLVTLFELGFPVRRLARLYPPIR